MLREDDFQIVGYCYYCGNFRYKQVSTGNLYVSCKCEFFQLKPRKLKLIKSGGIVNDNKCGPKCDCEAA